MVTRKELFTAVRSGTFVPFPWPWGNLTLKTQFYFLILGLAQEELKGLVEYITSETDAMPEGLRPKERLFCRALRQGLIEMP